ncbi:hypothetical protein Ciccas_002699 [Cichlidogyrus casuarinus]|uniref:Uncharacterized protein n=1 Tax=Cichlidogyrus casuarinus TaxID=1844966 RepID=A0ABD2QGI5_9PLAT
MSAQSKPQPRRYPQNSERTRIYRQPCRQRFPDAEPHTYLFEVHDFLDNKTFGDRFWANIRDFPNQTAVEVPYDMIHSLVKHLMTCKVDFSSELEHHEEDENEEAQAAHGPVLETVFDLKKLEKKRLIGLNGTFAIEISEDDKKTTKLLICDSLDKDAEPSAEGDSVKKDDRRDCLKPREKKGTLAITEWLLPRLVLFLRDVFVRHMNLTKNFSSVRNLYTPSGSRRFFFDLNETRWGNRLQVSQVTAQHRNVISLPLESLVLFRNRLNRIIRQLNIEEGDDIRIARAPRPRPAVPPRRVIKPRPVRSTGRPFVGRRFRPRPRLSKPDSETT